ncbi:MAG: argininosuccinate synthase [Planctomycetota bacterium]
MTPTQLAPRGKATQEIVLAFSGGLDTSWCVAWLRHEQRARVTTVTVDTGGFSNGELETIAARSRALGAEEHFTVGAKKSYFDEVLRFLIFGNVLRGHSYPICVGAERVLQAREVARVAHEIGASAVAHGSTAAGNDQVRFEIALRALGPELEILAPVRDSAPSRAQELEYLSARGYAAAAKSGDYSINTGLWGLTIGGKETHSTDLALPEAAWVRTHGAFDAPRAPTRIRIDFRHGVPCALNAEELAPVALIEKLDSLAASFGIGRGIHLGDTILGIKGRVAFEAPAATVLISAHRELEKLTLSLCQQRTKDSLAQVYGDLIHEGRFLEPACRDVEAFLQSSQLRVSGSVVALLRPGQVFIEGVTSPHSLVAASRAVYGEAAGEWRAADAAGFARIRALPDVLYQRAGAAVEAVQT